MTDITPQAVESEILRLSDGLSDATENMADVARRAAEADAAFKLAWAKAVRQAHEGAADQRKKPTVTEVEASAAIATREEYLTKKTAEAVLYAAQEAGRNMRSQLDALRSVNSNLRHQWTDS